MRNRFAFLIAIYMSVSSGCLYHAGYYPNGYGPGPSVLPAQPYNGYPNNGYPAQPIYPPSTSPLYQPGGTYPAPLNGPGFPTTPTPAQPDTNPPSTYGNPGGGNNNAPLFNTNPGNGSVPLPGDDNSTGYNPSSGTGITPTSSSKMSDDLSSPFNQESTRLPRNVTDDSVVEADPFQPPVAGSSVVQTSGSDDGGVDFADVQPASKAAARVYGHDVRFEWVQGIVEYDDANKLWVVMYDDNPRPTDKLGGELALINTPALARLRAGEAYRIEGSLDRSELDARGLPMYQATSFTRVQTR